MTDVRDREPEIIVAPAHADERTALPVEANRSLVGRALKTLRRDRGTELLAPTVAEPVPSPTRTLRQTELPAPRNRTRAIIILSIFAVIVLPVAAAAIYLFAIASDQYVAETRFAVRTAEAQASDGVKGEVGSMSTGSLLAGGPNLVGEDAGIIASYIHSRVAVEDVARTLDLRAIFRRPEADFFARLPADATAEELTAYWQKMIGVYVERSSGIIQVSASAFRREDALALTRAVLAASERLANSLNVKMQADQTRLAEDEVRRSEGGVRFALADLTSFRNAQRLINPVESATAENKLLLQLMSDKIETEGKLYVIQHAQGANAPGIAGVKARLESINTHIGELQTQIASDKDTGKNMAATLARFEELEIKKTFAEKMFEFSREGLERARLAAQRQSIYLAVFVQPSLPQDYTYPERWADILLVLLGCFMAWASGTVITASVADHRL